MKLLRLAAALLLAAHPGLPTAAQTPDPAFASPLSLYTTGQVYYLGPQQADGKRVVGGYFSRLNGAPSNLMVRLDDQGNPDLAFSQNVGFANASQVLGLPSGQYLLTSRGNTVTAGGITRTELLRLNANGSPDAAFNAGPGPSSANGFAYGAAFAVQPDGKVLVAGSFDHYNNAPAPGVVRLNANGSVDLTFNVGTGFNAAAYVYALAVQPDGKILVGGQFSSFNGQAAEALVRLNANGSVDATFTSSLFFNTFVEGLVVQPDGKVLANGRLALPGSGGPSYVGLARLLPAGGLDFNFVTSLFQEGEVSTSSLEPAVVLQPDGKVIVSGYFTGAVGNHLARLNDNGTTDLTFQVGVGPNQIPRSLGLLANGSLLVGGDFGAFSGVEQPLLRLTAAGAIDPAFAPRLQNPGNASALALQPDGKVLLGGDFTEINGQPVHRLVRLQPSGALDAGFSAATGVLPGPVTSLALQPNGKVVVGTGTGVSRYEASGSPDAGFAPFVSDATTFVSGITSLALQADGRVLVAGSLRGTSGGTSFNGLVRLTTAGTVDPSFARAVNDPVLGAAAGGDAVLVQADGRILLAGRFQSGTQNSLYRVVRYESTGALDATFYNTATYTYTGSTALGRVFALAQQPDGKLLVGGSFNLMDGVVRYNLARLTTAGTLDAGFASGSALSGAVRALAIQPNGRVLLGGNFSTAAAPTRTNLARVLDNGQLDATFGATANPTVQVRAVAVQPDGAILLAGLFTTVGGQARVGVARITAPNVLAVAAPAAVAARTLAWPVPAHGQLRIAPDFSAHPLALELLDALGRPVRRQPVTGAAEQTLNLDNLPAGAYLLRVHYAAGTVTRRVAVE